MPWTPETIKRHNGKLKGKSARQAADVADAVLAKTGDEGLALREANGVVKKDRQYQGRGKQGANDAKARGGQRRSWTGK